MEQFNLNTIPGKVAPVCHASQYDTGRIIRVNLFEGDQLYTLDGTEVVSVSVRKPDGHIVTEGVTNTGAAYVEIVTTEQMTACFGANLCELKIEKGADVIGTLNFILSVEEDPLAGGDPSESFVYNLATQIYNALADQYDSNNVIFDAAPTPGHGVPYTVTSEGIDAAMPKDLADLSDVTTNTPVSGEALVWDGTKWTNGTVSTVGSIDDLNDVDTTGKANGDSLRYDANSSEWVAKPIVVEVTQAEYDALALGGNLEPLTTYVITDAPNLNATASDIEYSSGVTVKQAIDSKADKSTPTFNLTCPRCPISSFESYKIQKIGNVIFLSADLNFGATSETGAVYFVSSLVDNADFVQGSLFDDLADTGYQIYKGRGGSLWVRNGNTGLAGATLVNKTRMLINLIIFKVT